MLIAAVQHVIEVVDQADDNLDDVVSSWLEAMSPSSLYDLLGQLNSTNICVLLTASPRALVDEPRLPYLETRSHNGHCIEWSTR